MLVFQIPKISFAIASSILISLSISFNLKHAQHLDNNQTGDNMSYDFLNEEVEHGR